MRAYIYGLSVGNKGDFILAGTSKCNEVKVFDRTDKNDPWKTCCTVSGIKKPIYSVNFAKGMKRCAFGGGDGQLYIMSIINNDSWKPSYQKK